MRFWAKAACLMSLAAGAVWGQPGSGSAYRYPLDFAQKLMPKEDMIVFVGQDGVAVDGGQTVPLLKARPIPMKDLSLAPNRGVFDTKPLSNWEMPPFAELDPVPPANAPASAKNATRKGLLKAAAFAHLRGPPSPLP